MHNSTLNIAETWEQPLILSSHGAMLQEGRVWKPALRQSSTALGDPSWHRILKYRPGKPASVAVPYLGDGVNSSRSARNADVFLKTLLPRRGTTSEALCFL